MIAEARQIGVHDPGDPLLLRSEAAERLNVSESTVVRLGRAGEITEIRVGKRAVRIDPASLKAYLRSRITTGEREPR